MANKRISATERKALILTAARQVFSRQGFDAAKTLEIAQTARVSEALVYRHFPSKVALYRAVLRQTIREQDDNFDILRLDELNAAGIIRTLKAYFTFATSQSHVEMQDRFRLLLASLAGDGTYAKLVYRRAQRMMGHTIDEALRNARDAGDLRGQILPSDNTSMFIEHVGTMMSAICWQTQSKAPYATSGELLARQAVWFCCRGIGFTDEAIARHIDDPA